MLIKRLPLLSLVAILLERSSPLVGAHGPELFVELVLPLGKAPGTWSVYETLQPFVSDITVLLFMPVPLEMVGHACVGEGPL